MSLLLFHQGNVPIIEDDMKLAKVPLPSNDRGWTSDVISTAELTTIFNQVKNGQIDGIMLVDSQDYGGQHEQKAISTGFRFIDYFTVEFHFSHTYSVNGSQPLGEGFVNTDQTRAIVTVTISSTGMLFYQYHTLK